MGEDVIANYEEITAMTLTARRPKVDRNLTEVGRGGEATSTTMDREILMRGLNHDLAGEYQAILMYIHYPANELAGQIRAARATVGVPISVKPKPGQC
jgi:hypothetical protein